MPAYTQFTNRLQEPACTYAQTREQAESVAPCRATELSELLQRCEAHTDDDKRRIFSTAFLLGYMSAQDFWRTLIDCRLFDPYDAFLTAYATGVLQIAAEAETAPTALPVPPTVRVTSFAKGGRAA